MNKFFNKTVAALICGSAMYATTALASGGAQYEVTITNLTRAQIFTPILVASHRKGIHIFEPGSAAGTELASLAEGGDVVPLTDKLEAYKNVDVENSGGLLMPGASVTVTVSADRGARWISLASMMIPTNDSFIALDAVKAPKNGKAIAYYSPGYDAGSEPNDEICLNIPGPVCKGEGGSPGAGGEGYVHVSGGIHGIADLEPETYGWHNPTAKIVIERVSNKEDH